MKMRTRFTTVLLVLAGCACAPGQAQQTNAPSALGIIPKPIAIDYAAGKFTIDAKTRVVMDKKSAVLSDVANFLAEQLRQSTGYPLPVVTGGEVKGLKNAILLSVALVGKTTGDEGYELSVTPNFVRIAANAPPGVFYGMQTMFQLMPKEFEYGSRLFGVAWEIPCLFIQDSPRFAWRGMHLDVGRHFASKNFVKKYVDLIARYKFNTFHWHLTEDQGWRVEIKKYPRLTEVGSWRAETMGDGQPHGGYYTQDDVREIVEYAKRRHVTIVPEIEMPGHAMAAISAYPGLSCTGGPFRVQTVWGVFDDVFCAGNDSTFAFLQDVLTELMQLFPGTFYHIGGDECPKARWKTCPKCQARMKTEGLADEHELQSYFVRRMERFLNNSGKRLIGWDEILEGGLAPNATVMSWRGVAGGIAAAKSGHDVVMTPTSHCYFDYYQAVNGEPRGIGGFLPLERVYAYEPVPAELTPEEATHILGAQGNVWTEYMPMTRQVEYMAFPRACALSEVVWSQPEKRDFQDFSLRMASHYERLVAHDVNVRIPSPTGFAGPQLFTRDTVFEVFNPIPGAMLRYTTDGSEPTEASRAVEGPVAVGRSLALRARTFLKSGKASPIATGYMSLVDTNANGVEYAIFDGRAATLKEIETMTPVASGSVYGIGLEGLPLPKDTMTILFTGVLAVHREGVYAFTVSADENAALFVDKSPVASDTTSEWWRLAGGRIFLRSGPHALAVMYTRNSRGARLDLQIEGPALDRQRIPAAMLRRR